MSEWKEYISVENLTLVVAIATLLVSIAAFIVAKRAYRYTRKHDRQTLLEKIESKKAQLEAIESIMGFGAVDHSQMGNMMAQQSALKSEIELLKRQL